MADRDGIFAGDDPMQIAARWLTEAETTEPNDANAAALSTVDASGMPNARIVLIKSIGSDSFVFYTNYNSAKGQELSATPKAAFVIHWKSLRRQIRVRGRVEREDGAEADAYYQSRAHGSRIGAWASPQSQPIETREALRARVVDAEAKHGDAPDRPPFWGGFRITPEEIEFWSDGTHRLHDRFRWTRNPGDSDWKVTRLGP